MTPLASTLPSNDGYVAAAYIVFFALVLIYVAIMAIRLTRVERKLHELRDAGSHTPADTDGQDLDWSRTEDASERETRV